MTAELRAGADIRAGAAAGAPTPLALAEAAMPPQHPQATHGAAAAAGGAGGSAGGMRTAAGLVLRAAQPWSPATHELHPRPARAYAVALLLLGRQLSLRWGDALVDAWVVRIMPLLVHRNHRGTAAARGCAVL